MTGGAATGGDAAGGAATGGAASGGAATGGSASGGDVGAGGSGGQDATGGSSSGGSGAGTSSPFCKSFDNGSGTTQPCYVGNDGAAHCIADDGSTTTLSEVSGSVINSSGKNFSTEACAVDAAGAVFCGQYGSMTEWLSSGASQVSGSLTGQCALVNGGVTCSGVEGPESPSIPGTVDQIRCFYHGCCAGTDEGKMYCWGDTAAVGGSGTDPVEIPLPDGKKLVQLGPGQDHLCALVEGGQVQCWGQDWNAQIGGTTNSSGNTTTGETLVASGAVAVAAGQFHTCVALSDGTVECVSASQSEGAGLDMGTLTLVSGVSSAVALSAGKHYTCALLADSSIQCWGRIGGGTTPIVVSGPPAASCD